MPTPVPNLNPMERRILAAVVGGSPGEMMLDWVAFRRLIKFGYIEETDTGIKATAEGKRALNPSPSSS